MPELRLLYLLLSITLGLTAAHASDVGDSLRYVLDADASMADRSRALVQLAQRSMVADPAGALVHAGNAIRFAEQTNDDILLHDALSITRDIQSALGLQTEYLRTTLRALNTSQKLGDPVRIAMDLQAISTAYRMNRRMDKALQEARNALAMALPTQDEALILRARLLLVRTLNHVGKYSEALIASEEALATGSSIRHQLDHGRVRALMAQSLIALGRYNDAGPYLAAAERALSGAGTADELIMLHLDQARAAAGAGRHADADGAFAEALALMDLVDAPETKLALLRTRYELSASRKDPQAALADLQRLRAAEDSTEEAGRNLVLAGMQVMYELDQKDRDNSDLRDRNARNEAVIADQRFSNRWLLAAASLLLALAITLFFIARNNRRTARRSRLKSDVIQRQKDEIHAKHLELQRQNMRLAEALMSDEQKDIVIKEIHHRVKNNMQVIESLLNMAHDPGDQTSHRALKQAQGRIRAMSMVHETIHRCGGEEQIPVRSHLEELARNVLVAHGRHDSISVMVQVGQSIMHASDLMALSLLVNELLTNAVKYAFAGRDRGTIRITLRTTPDSMELVFTDDGIGMESQSPYTRPDSFGMRLLNALVQQLNGTISISSGEGTSFRLRFVPDRMEHRKAS